MLIKKIIRISFIVLTCSILSNCETSQNYQLESYSSGQSFDNKNNSTLMSEGNLDDFNQIYKNEKEEIDLLNVGLLLPLSGEHYLIGASLLNSAQLALDKTRPGNITFHVADTGDPNAVLQNFYNIIQNDLDLIIGPVFSENIEKIRNVLKEKNLLAVTLSNNSLMENKNTFVFGLTLQNEINTLLEYSEQINLKEYVVIIPDSQFGNNIKNTIVNLQSIYNTKNFRFIYYDPQSPDYYGVSKAVSRYEERKINLEKQIELMKSFNTDTAKKELKRLSKLDTFGKLDFEAIIIFAEKYSDISNFSSILPYYDVDPKRIQYISNSILARDMTLKEPGLKNVYFTSLNIGEKKKFEKDYSLLFNNKPHKLSTLTYDIVGLISKIYNETGDIQSIFNSDSGFIGLDGWFKFSSDGNVIRRPNIYQIKNDKFVKIY